VYALRSGRGPDTALLTHASLRQELSAWLPVPKRPDGAMLLGHLGTMHPLEVGSYLARMRTEDMVTVAAEASEVVEEK
jgi:hypothetical protein